MSMLRSGRVKFSIITVVAVLILGIVGAGLIQANHTNELYDGPVSVDNLTSARGVVFDAVETKQALPTGARNWIISGEWTLDCGGLKCTDDRKDFSNIHFDTAFAMFLDGKDKGDLSHGHTFANFEAESASVADDTLTIVGTIEGSGPLGGHVIITLKRHSSGPKHFTFSFNLDEHNEVTNIIMDPIGGVVIESTD